MFEVGKLTDESLDSFLGELEKASFVFLESFLPPVLIVNKLHVYLLFIYRLTAWRKVKRKDISTTPLHLGTLSCS